MTLHRGIHVNRYIGPFYFCNGIGIVGLFYQTDNLGLGKKDNKINWLGHFFLHLCWDGSFCPIYCVRGEKTSRIKIVLNHKIVRDSFYHIQYLNPVFIIELFLKAFWIMKDTNFIAMLCKIHYDHHTDI